MSGSKRVEETSHSSSRREIVSGLSLALFDSSTCWKAKKDGKNRLNGLLTENRLNGLLAGLPCSRLCRKAGNRACAGACQQLAM